jgi:hypothetical protein
MVILEENPPMISVRIETLVFVLGILPSVAPAQQSCPNGIRIEGTITDPTGAVVPSAQVQASDGENAVADATGRYILPCTPVGTVGVNVQAEGFGVKSLNVKTRPGQVMHINVQLEIGAVQTDVQVSADADDVSGSNGAGTTALNTKQVQQLADDPDDFLRQLQVLAANSGGDPSAVVIVVDGFQNASALPPKSSIASIRINPDFFAPEYQTPNWHGGRVEITTKPGADKIHGALFYTNSNDTFNATNPFSTTPTPAGKQRYGFELSGPLLPKKVDFALALEKRNIDEFNVVNATTLNASGNQTAFRQTVEAPQRLWIASARGNWQVSPKDVATLSFSANVNSQGNQGVGGLVLPEAGYTNLVSEYDLRLSNTLTLNANTLHETRIGYSWKRTKQAPNSTAPALQVAGYFTSGGATSQNLNNRERDLEVDDDIIATRGKHEIKFGVQSITSFVHDFNPDTFNGAYVFGGGSAPVLDANNSATGQTTTISGIEQYRRALLNLPGGTPTTYQLTTGTALVPLTQWQLSWYAQDTVRLSSHLTVTGGLRYQLETTPDSFANLRPRLGLSWVPDKKQTWAIHLRTGLFSGWDTPSYATEVYRLNGTRQQQLTVYSPRYSNPLTPIVGSIQVNTRNQFSRSFGQIPNLQLDVRVEHEFPHHWHAQAEYGFGSEWQTFRIVNINAPLVNSSVGVAPDPIAALLAPRPIAPNENIMQSQNYGHGRGAKYVLNLKQNSYKRFSLDATYWYLDFMDNSQTPQSTYNVQGESGRPDWMRRGGFSMLATVNLPYKVDLSTQFDTMPGRPFNITTGTDANGDGIFNDRPSYAPSPGVGTYSTRYGLLTTNAVNGSVPYNAGTMPGVIHLDTNLSRAFSINTRDKEHPPTLTFNARSANLLNHSNVTAVNTILSSGTVGQSIAAEAARRVELGARFTF